MYSVITRVSISFQVQSQFEGNVQAVKILLENGSQINTTDNGGWTSLHCAARKGHLEVVKILLENGADRDVNNEDKKTALDLAVERGYDEISECLLIFD